MAAPLGEHRPVVQQQFLESFRRLKTLGRAAEEIGVNRSCVYRWLNSDLGFAEAFDAARENIVDELEASVIDRAQKSDLLAMFVMKRFRPAYRDRLNIDIEKVDSEIRELMSKLNFDPQKLLAAFASEEPAADSPELKLLEATNPDHGQSTDQQ